ncbi:MAG: replication-associated recombination protein A, partial [Clostridia bacterium]|nr:replication-associated recombination protein A [Clostridia bacterium]
TGIKELKEILEKSKGKFFGLQKEATYLYVDEFHRWNKLQQDSLLKALEDGVIRFIGSTTENPYFAVNNAILSRVRSIYEFKALKKEHVFTLLKRALNDSEKGLANKSIEIDPVALDALADLSSGDARIALDTLGFLSDNLGDSKKITLELVGEAMQRRTTFYDKSEDKYQLLSALQKSIRGSDPDAAIHYLARLLKGGDDLMMIGRRLLVIASEDIGMAYPSAITIVTSCVKASLMVGLPEAQINLAQAVILMASCPKSNASYMALMRAQNDLEEMGAGAVPSHLADSHYQGAKDRGHGLGYQYPHEFGGYVKQQYLPDDLVRKGARYYLPTENGSEIQFKKFLQELKERFGED